MADRSKRVYARAPAGSAGWQPHPAAVTSQFTSDWGQLPGIWSPNVDGPLSETQGGVYVWGPGFEMIRILLPPEEEGTVYLITNHRAQPMERSF